MAEKTAPPPASLLDANTVVRIVASLLEGIGISITHKVHVLVLIAVECVCRDGGDTNILIEIGIDISVRRGGIDVGVRGGGSWLSHDIVWTVVKESDSLDGEYGAC